MLIDLDTISLGDDIRKCIAETDLMHQKLTQARQELMSRCKHDHVIVIVPHSRSYAYSNSYDDSDSAELEQRQCLVCGRIEVRDPDDVFVYLKNPNAIFNRNFDLHVLDTDLPTLIRYCIEKGQPCQNSRTS